MPETRTIIQGYSIIYTLVRYNLRFPQAYYIIVRKLSNLSVQVKGVQNITPNAHHTQKVKKERKTSGFTLSEVNTKDTIWHKITLM